MLRRLFVAAALVSSASAAIAAPTYIHAGRLIAVPGKAPLGPSTIVVDNGRIVEIREGHAPPPAGATAIDLRDRTVLPGLIDSHVHLASDRGGEQAVLADIRDDDPLHAYEAQLNGMKTVRAGFTTVRNLGDDKGVTMGLREAVKRGWVQGPRIVDAAQSISTTGGHMDGRGSLNDELVAHLPDPEFLAEIRDLDMRASPYDLSDLGYQPVPVETPDGRAEYARAQRAFAERAGDLRRRLVDVCDALLP